ncbi:MAG: alanine dehydrogenase [Ectothiorhodospiraceae bacterium AqS1]|nr:alanine dehydrogenase [Ectothiorhodospiraceae bacterium AqS1]
MLIGVPKEIKNHEYRVGLTPQSVQELTAHGHRALVETGAGSGIGAADEEYEAAGAQIATDASEVFARAEMIVKVKEPQAVERAMLREEQILFTYLHLAPDRPQTEELVRSKAVCIAYETVTSPAGGLPLLAPMSEVAGRLSIQAAAHCLEKVHGGKGVLMGGVPGVSPAKVVVIGGGMVGTHAADVAVGMGAETTVIDRSPDALKSLWRQFGHSLLTAYSTRSSIERSVLEADVVIGGVLVPGAAAPKLVSAQMIREMKPGSVVVDVAIDQGGCFETSRPTTHSDPTYIVDDVVHYCVANMPGAVPRTSTFALNNVTLPHVLTLADKGYRKALQEDPHLREGLNVHAGEITCLEVAKALDYPFKPALEALAA